MANFLREKYAGVHFDAGRGDRPSGLPFILKFREVVGPGVPIIFSDLTSATYEALRLPPDVTGVINDLPLERPWNSHKPSTRRTPACRNRAEATASIAAGVEIARKAIDAHHPKLETAYWSDLTYDALLADVSRLPSDSIVLLLTFFADSEGKRFIPRNVAAAVAKASSRAGLWSV